MKVEINIEDDALRDYLEAYIAQNIKGKYGPSINLQGFLNEQVKRALERAFLETDFLLTIEQACKDVALAEIEKASGQKVPGWVRQQMKEMLKYARADYWKSRLPEEDQV